jgi:hypothetical protein
MLLEVEVKDLMHDLLMFIYGEKEDDIHHFIALHQFFINLDFFITRFFFESSSVSYENEINQSTQKKSFFFILIEKTFSLKTF